MGNQISCLQEPCSTFDFNQIENSSTCYLNPLEAAGIAHNELLAHLLAKPVMEDMKTAYERANSFMAGRYRIKPEDFLPWKTIYLPILRITDNGYAAFLEQKNAVSKAGAAILNKLQQQILNADEAEKFESAVHKLVFETLSDAEMKRDDKNQILGAIAVATNSIRFWNAESEDDLFDLSAQARRAGPFWSDIGGFLFGFGVTLFNDGVPGNPITNGVTVGAFASAAAKAR